MANHDRVIADEHLLDEQAHEALPLQDVQRIRRRPQPGKKRRECFREAQIHRPLARLIGDRLQLGAQRLLALTQRRHPLAQLLERQEVFLIGGEYPLDALAHAHQFALHRLFALFRGVGGARGSESPIEFVLNQSRILEQPNDLGPDELIQEILSHGSVVAARAAEVPPGVRSDAAIVVDQARTRTGRRARERVAAAAAAHQTLHQARCNRAAPRPDFVLVQQFLRAGKGRLLDEGRDRNLDPVLARSFMAGAVATRHAAAQPERPRHALPRGHTGFAEAGHASIRRVAQHRPDHRALPPGAGLPRRHAVLIEPAGDRPDAPARHSVGLIDLLHHARLGFDHDIGGGRLITLPDIAIAVGRAAQHADFSCPSPVPFPAPRALENLRAFVLGDHPLKLHEELILGRRALRRVQKAGLDAVPRELFDQQDLIGILATQAIGTVDEDGLDLSFGRQIAHPLQTGPFERGAAIALVFDDPGRRHLEIERPRPLDQRRRLARNRVCLPLLFRRHPRVNRGRAHAHAPLQTPRAGGLEPAPTTRTRGRACRPGADRTHIRAEPPACRDGRAAQPRRRRTLPSNAASASVTICPIVSPRRRACTRSARTVCTGSFKVMATVGATAGTGARSAAAC